jgi:RNA polymerase sigma factor (sigma-70 family)
MPNQTITEFHTLRQMQGAQRDALINSLVQRHYGLVHTHAERFYHATRTESTFDYDDIEQAAAVGLFRAIREYDPDSGNAFSSYAVSCIVGSIRHLIRDTNAGGVKIPRQSRELYAKWQRLWRQYPSFSLEQVAIAELTYRGTGRIAALQRFRQVEQDCSRKSFSDVDKLQIEGKNTSDRVLEIQKVLAKLPHPIGFVLRNSVEMPLEQIAEYLGVSIETVDDWLLQGRQMLRRFEEELI